MRVPVLHALAGALVAAALLAAPASAVLPLSEIHVSPRGSDTTGNGSIVLPYRTIGKALSVSAGGETIAVEPGSYPRPASISSLTYTDKRQHTSTVTVRATGPGAEVEGFRIDRAANVRFEGLRFTHTLEIFGGRGISVADSEFVGGENGITIRGGATGVTVEGNHFRGIGTGIKAPNYGSTDPRIALVSKGIRIRDNLMEKLRVDGIQAGWWADVEITGNVIRHLDHPTGTLHNDGIQVYGQATDWVVARNSIYDSGGQGLLVSAEVGPIRNFRLEANLVAGTEAVAAYLLSVQGLVVIGNTVWRNPNTNTYAGIVLKNRDNTSTASDAVVVDNLTSELHLYMPIAYRGYNLAGSKGAHWNHYQHPGPGERYGVVPGFVDPANWNFHLLPGSPARGAGIQAYGLGADRDGARRADPPSVGAYE